MNRFRRLAIALTSSILLISAAGQSQAAVKQLASPKILTAAATSTTSVHVTFTTVPGASSYTVFLYLASGKSFRSYPSAVATGTSIPSLAVCTGYRVAVQAISGSRTVSSSAQSGKVAVTTQCNPALVPTFAAPVSTSDGFSVQITNYDAAFMWSGTVTAGSVSIDGNGLATVAGLTATTPETLTVTTSRPTYDTGAASVSGALQSTPTQWIGSGDFTIEFWVKPTIDWTNAGRQELIAFTSTTVGGRLDVFYDGGQWFVYHDGWTASTPIPVTASAPAVGVWTHIALARQSGAMRLYVAGQKLAESSPVGDPSGLNMVLLGADPNSVTCKCNLASALLSNVRIIDGTALYTGNTLTIPTSALAKVAGTSFLLNDALGDPAVGSVELDGSTRYEQTITTVSGVTTVSSLNAFHLDAGNWSTSTVVTSIESPFKICLSSGLRASGLACQVGDATAAGGTIFYASTTPFTSLGSPCNTNCHYLEVAPTGWAPLTEIPDNTTDAGQTTTRTDASVDPYLSWWDRAWSDEPPAGTASLTGIGSGMANTQDIKAKALAVTPTPTLSTPPKWAFLAALIYAGAGSTSTVGEWFLPSIGELNELCKFATSQTADLGNTSIGCAGAATGGNVPRLGFLTDYLYWSSSYPYMEGSPYPYPGTASPAMGQTPGYYLKKSFSSPSSYYGGYYSTYGEYVRPIRAF